MPGAKFLKDIVFKQTFFKGMHLLITHRSGIFISLLVVYHQGFGSIPDSENSGHFAWTSVKVRPTIDQTPPNYDNNAKGESSNLNKFLANH